MRSSNIGKKRFGLSAGEGDPSVSPGILLVGQVMKELPRLDEKAVPRGKLRFEFPRAKGSASGNDMMQQIIIDHFRPYAMLGPCLAFARE